MDPCPFVRLIVESLALKLPAVSKPAGPGVHPSATPCFCVLDLPDCSLSHTTPLPIAAADASPTPAAVFSVDPPVLHRLAGKPAMLSISVYAGRTGRTCGLTAGRLLGRVRVAAELHGSRAAVLHSGWVAVGAGARLHLVVRSEPDPRFVFQFGGEPECSPVVFQLQGAASGGGAAARQPVFSCRFSAERRRRSSTRSLPSDSSSSGAIGRLLSSMGSHRGRPSRDQRTGWMVTIHDLSGSPAAAASMVTPFVPSPGSDRVSRSNPGAWLILRPATGGWKPWGRLEAWRERGPTEALGYRFELVGDDGAGGGVPIAESSLSVRKGGQFVIDPSAGGEVVSRSWPFVEGFVMGSTVEGEGRVSRPTVHVGVSHVTCMADVALFVALAAAVDLSMDACRLFSHKLKKELCHQQQDYSL